MYKFDSTKESWHEFALKSRVIADSSGYEDIIDGTKSRPDERKTFKYFQEMMPRSRRQKKEKLAARMANKKGYRDQVMSTEGISLNIVENATSDNKAREI